MKRLGVAVLALTLVGGCYSSTKPATVTSATPSAPAMVLSADKLRTVFPKLAAPFSSTEFRAKPGIVTVHVKKGTNLVGTLMVMDLFGDAASRKEFDGARTQVNGYPSISTSMGGGIAVLAEDRFRVEVDSLGPEVSDRLRTQWLESFDWKAMKGWAK